MAQIEVKPLAGKTIAIVATDGFEQIELTSPKEALERAGASTKIISPKKGSIQGWKHHDKADMFKVDLDVASARADDFDALLLPGGVANPDALRTDQDVLKFVRAFFEAGKPVAAICHAPWTLIDAEVVDGRRMTSYKSLRTDLLNAGAQWVDEACVVDNGLVTSRDPNDLPAFNRKVVEEVGEGVHTGQTT
ncbi:MAG: type 1 glutamine amidotransferase [Phycisphaerales bacterium]|nr:type 1 glutamine amidotransferase [Phycisphaerales bacterium]